MTKDVSAVEDEHNVERVSTMLLGKLEALTVDSASDELLGERLLRWDSVGKKKNSTTPNFKLVIRDATHATQRTNSTHPRLAIL